MRALRWPDAWPAGDIALHHALGLQGTPRERERACEAAAQAWRPWRSYAQMHVWGIASRRTDPPARTTVNERI